MNRAFLAMAVGVLLLFGAIALDLVGSSLQSLPVLVISFALAIAGAMTALRGIMEFVGERL